MQGFIRIGRMKLEIPVVSNIGTVEPAQLTKTTTITRQWWTSATWQTAFVLLLSDKNYAPANLKAQ